MDEENRSGTPGAIPSAAARQLPLTGGAKARRDAGGGVPRAGARGAGRFWALRQAAEDAGVLEMYIYGDVEGNYWDWRTGEEIKSDTSAEHFKAELAKFPEAKEIRIFINSYGGEVFEGTAIYNQLKRHKARKVVYVDGFACSIASVIAMAGDEVIMPRNTMMMIHDMRMATVGNARQLRKAADDLEAINAAGRQAYLSKAGDRLTETRLRHLMEAETWLSAAQCIELGLADRYADEEADMNEAAAILQRGNAALQQQLERQRAIAAQLRELCGSGVNPQSPPQVAGTDGTPGAASPTDETPKFPPRAAATDGAPGAASPAAEPKAEAKKPTLMEFLARV